MGVYVDLKQSPAVSRIKNEDLIQKYLECVYNPLAFAQYAKIKDATTNRIIDFQLWPHERLLLLTLASQRYKRTSLFKSKQIGCSWTVGGIFHLWRCHRLATNILSFSKGEDYAADLNDKARFINDRMPDWLRLRYGQNGSQLITFPDTHSRIKALPSTEDAGVGETASHVTRDELEFHDYAEENYSHVAPTVDAGAATLLDMSTSKRSHPNSHMKETYRKALRNENDVHPMFFHAFVRPDRTWKWYYDTMRNYPVKWMFEQDYPLTLNDCLGGVEGMGLFDVAVADKLINLCKAPPQELSGGAFIYKLPDSGLWYYAGADIAEGRGGDYSVLWIEGAMKRDRYLCAGVRTNILAPREFAFYANTLLRQYGSPQLICGNDTWGLVFLGAMKDLGYYNIFSNSKHLEKPGMTESSDMIQANLMNFAQAVKDGLWIQWRPVVDEMFGWIVDDKNRWKSTGAFDDCVSAAAKADFAYRNLSKPGWKLVSWSL